MYSSEESIFLINFFAITPTLGLPLEFFSILGINRPIPLFIKDIDEQIEIIKVKKDKLNTKKNTQDKTKDGLNKVSFFRVYNGLYRQIEQKYKNIENSPTINSQILFEILEYHLAFLKMKNIPINDENFDISTDA